MVGIKNTVISVCFAVALAVLGYVVPLMFPMISPVVQRVLFGFAILLLFVGAVLCLLRTKAEPASMPAPKISQSHSGTGHNIVADTVNLGSQRFEWTDELLNGVASALDPNRDVAIAWRNKGRGPALASTLRDFLTAKGFCIGGEMGIGEITGVEFEQAVTVSMDGFNFGGISILGGSQAVAIEPEAGR